MDDLKGRSVLVTGASTGIGAACALAFGQLGCRVAVHYHRSRGEAEAVAGAIRAAGGDGIALQADLRRSAECERLVAEAAAKPGHIDILINNAGALVRRLPITEVDDDTFAEVVNLNVRSLLMCTRYALPHMPDGGSILNVTSIAARTGGGPGASLYAGSKAFVSTATRSLAKELAPRGIRVNAVAPGVIVTPFHDKYSTPEQLEAMRATIPMGRLGDADECVGAFLYLASARLSGYVTGQIIEVNGGQYMP